jgi:tetratricopeptide (TPR) repeat protein
MKKGMFREAAERFEKALEVKPDSNFAMVDLLSALINSGNNDKAVEMAGLFLERFPRDAVLYEELGLAHFFRRDYGKSLEALLKSIEIEPGPVALIKTGEIYALQSEHETAESYIRRALELNPRSRGAYYVLAQIEEARGHLDQAVAYYEKELEVNPREYKASWNAAVFLKREGHYERAIPYYQKTIGANPQFHVPYFMVANYHLERDTNLPEAIGLCKRGIDVAPEDEATLFGYQVLLRLLAKTGDKAGFDLYSKRAEELLRKLGKDR